MKTHFYSHIIRFERISIILDELELSQDEKKELQQIADANIHHVILDVVLKELPEEQKKEFLSHMTNNDHESIWDLLRSKTVNIENKIQQAANDFIQVLLQDIEEAKKIKNSTNLK